MTNRNIVLIGGPDSGKTNFIGRLWIALRQNGGTLSIAGTPGEIKYVEEAVAYMHQGRFAPRTDQNLESAKSSVSIPLKLTEGGHSYLAELVVPDIYGEIWKDAVETTELATEWMDKLGDAFGALIFVRVLSELNRDPLDWVTSAELMAYQGVAAQATDTPTQVMLCEFIRFLELKLPVSFTGNKPRIAVLVTAWDLVDGVRSPAGPRAYLHEEYPLFAGRLADLDRFEVRVFAVSVFGGDPETDTKFRDELLDSDFKTFGYVRYESDGKIVESSDLTLPVAWVIREQLSL
jgi:hypothetical protein